MLIDALFAKFEHLIWLLMILYVGAFVSSAFQIAAIVYEGDKTPLEEGFFKDFRKNSFIFFVLTGIGLVSLPYNPKKYRHKYGVALVGLAHALGTAFLLSISALVVFLLASNHSVGSLMGTKFQLIKFFKIASYAYASLFLFNLMPIPPLNGFRIILSLFPKTKALFMQLGENFCYVIITLLVLPGLGSLLSQAAKVISHSNIAFWSHLLSFWS